MCFSNCAAQKGKVLLLLFCPLLKIYVHFDFCFLKFKNFVKLQLIQHRRMHTGEKPHLCPHCPYRSARRDNLRSHVRRVHKKENLFCDTFSPRGLGLGTSASSPTSSHE